MDISAKRMSEPLTLRRMQQALVADLFLVEEVMLDCRVNLKQKLRMLEESTKASFIIPGVLPISLENDFREIENIFERMDSAMARVEELCKELSESVHASIDLTSDELLQQFARLQDVADPGNREAEAIEPIQNN